MAKVYRNKAPIPIPAGLSSKPNDGRIEVTVDVNGTRKYVTIGYAATSVSMYVNDAFRDMFPELWIKYYGDKEIAPDRLYIGCYALTLGIIHKTGMYPLLLKAYEPGLTNAILDYAMYSILTRSDVTQLYPIRMQEEVLFSNDVYSDNWYSECFKSKITSIMIDQFRKSWLVHCHKRGITKCWVSIDGSNNDCEVRESDLSEYGYAKSGNDSKIVSFIYAVNAEDGTPITYYVNPGSVIDSKAFMEIAALLKSASIEIEGVILDSGFCTYEVIQTIISLKYDYIIMTPCDTHGHTSMIQSEGQNIKWKSEYCVSDEGGLYGTTKKQVLFRTHPDLEAYINLYFDSFRGTNQSADLSSKIRKTMRNIQTKLDDGKNVKIPGEMNPYLKIEELNGRKTVIPANKVWDAQMEKKGFFSLASSRDFGAEQALQIYHLRDTSETGYCILKSQQGFHTTRVHFTEGIESKFAVCFVGNIIRHEIFLACKSLDLDTNVMIQHLDRIYLRRGTANSYYAVHMLSQNYKDLYEAVGIKPEHFERFAVAVNKRRNTAISNNVHVIPEIPKPVTIVKPRKRGRPVGSKNKKTLEKEAAIEAMILSGIDPSQINPKKPNGRPKGSKDTVPRKRRTKAEMESARHSS